MPSSAVAGDDVNRPIAVHISGGDLPADAAVVIDLVRDKVSDFVLRIAIFPH